MFIWCNNIKRAPSYTIMLTNSDLFQDSMVVFTITVVCHDYKSFDVTYFGIKQDPWLKFESIFQQFWRNNRFLMFFMKENNKVYLDIKCFTHDTKLNLLYECQKKNRTQEKPIKKVNTFYFRSTLFKRKLDLSFLSLNDFFRFS